MLKIQKFIFLALLSVLFSIDAYAACEHGFFGSGDGTRENPYIIRTAEEFEHMFTVEHREGKKYFQQQNDLSLPSPPRFRVFNNIYDGNNHKIEMKPQEYPQAVGSVFGEIKKEGVVKNIIFDRLDGSNTSFVIYGVSQENHGLIENVHLARSVLTQASSRQVAGIAVINYGTVSRCSNRGNTFSINYARTAGGIVAENRGGLVEKCWVQMRDLSLQFDTIAVGG